jgi:hypothetical protein
MGFFLGMAKFYHKAFHAAMRQNAFTQPWVQRDFSEKTSKAPLDPRDIL